GGTGKHEVLPDADAQFVADVVKGVVLINAAAPHAQHVHVGGGSIHQQTAVIVGGQARDEGIRRNPVGAFGEERHAVDGELERFAPFVRVTIQPQSPQTDAPAGAVQ